MEKSLKRKIEQKNFFRIRKKKVRTKKKLAAKKIPSIFYLLGCFH
jgi:hypothetical protein